MTYRLLPLFDRHRLTDEESRLISTDSLFSESEPADRAIAVCDNEEAARQCEARGMAHIFYDPAAGAFGHKYLITSLMGLYTEDGKPDIGYLDEVYARHFGLPLTVITTKRTYLREVSKRDVEADVRALKRLYDDPAVIEYMEPLYPFDEEVEYEKKYIENIYELYGYGMWLVCEKETDEVIGRAGIETRDGMDSDTVELGYIIGSAHRRKGLAREVCIAITDYAKSLGKTRIVCRVSGNNAPSVALMASLGFSVAVPRPAEAAAVGDDLFFEKIDF